MQQKKYIGWIFIGLMFLTQRLDGFDWKEGSNNGWNWILRDKIDSSGKKEIIVLMSLNDNAFSLTYGSAYAGVTLTSIVIPLRAKYLSTLFGKQRTVQKARKAIDKYLAWTRKLEIKELRLDRSLGKKFKFKNRMHSILNQLETRTCDFQISSNSLEAGDYSHDFLVDCGDKEKIQLSKYEAIGLSRALSRESLAWVREKIQNKEKELAEFK